MARAVDLEIETKSGKVDFDPLMSGQQDAGIYVRKFDLEALISVDPKTGSPKGTREYPGITIEKRHDMSSPKLLELFVNQTGFKATFRIHKPSPASDDMAGEVAATVTIGAPDFKAWISRYELKVPDVEKLAKDDPDEPYERIVFSFTTIEYHKSGTGFDGKQHQVVVQDSLVGLSR